MKNIFTFSLLIAVFFVSAQSSKANWQITPNQQKVFIENKGQWNGRNNLLETNVVYATDYGATQILFTKHGLTYRLENKKPFLKNRKEQEEEAMRKNGKLTHEEWEEFESRQGLKKETDFVQMEWENSNPNVEVVGLYTVNNYFNYGMGKKSVDHVNGYEKLLYKNLYKDIDVEYTFHPKGGIEYSFILHPGADASVIKMKYSDVGAIKLDGKKNIHYATKFGDIVEHAPHTFYQNNTGAKISSSFIRTGNIISFALGNYDKTKTVVLDPWVQAPAFNTQWDCVWECEKDAAGNVYIIGGVMSMQLLKYNPTGTLQWTYITPYDTSNCWLGTFATDNAGNSYVTRGALSGMQKIDATGTLVWDNTGGGGSIGNSDEYWSIAFNCDQTKLVVGGTSGAFALPPKLEATIFDINTSNGNVISTTQKVAYAPTIAIPPHVQEVRAITACGNGKYYFLTQDTIGYINQNFSLCAPNNSFYKNTSTYAFGYKCENFRVNNTGIAAIKSYGGFIFTHRGDRLDKRLFSTAAIIASVAIPGGGYSTQFGGSYVGNSGIDIDANGNIYVGSKNQVVKFNQSLTQLATYATTFNVYDVHVSTGGNIIACGSTGNQSSGARTGSIQSIAANAASPQVITCCDATVCQAGPLCSSVAPFSLVAGTTGGNWSGVGITNSSTGVFSPLVAGPGVHVITNTLGCGSDSIAIIVNNCTAVTACKEANGDITASGGSSTYTWKQQIQQQDCSACLFGICIPGFCNGTTVNVWQEFATGITVTPPGTYPLQIVDGYGTALVINSLASLSPCSTTCTLAASATHNNTSCGANNGSVTVVPTGGTPTGYAWSNSGTTATISNVPAGTYTVTVTAGGCTATASAVVSSSTGITASASSTNAGCASTGTATAAIAGGTATGYAWSNSGTTATISNLAAGSYTVTITSSNSCTATATTTVGSTGGITLSSSTTGATCGSNNGSATVTVTAGTATGYNWSSGAQTATASNLTSGTYTITVTGSGGCSATATAVVTATGAPTITTSATGASCNTNNGSATVTLTSGTATGYAWSSGATTATASNLAAGTYTVTVTGTGGCTATASTTVSAATGIVISASSTNTSCGNSNGTATVSVTQGNATGYAWSNSATTSSITGVAAGTYTVTVHDAGNCSATASVVIGGSGGTNVLITSDKTIMCATDSAHVCAPTGYVSYLWNTGATTPCITTKLAGNYYVTVTDNGSCTATSNHLAINVHPQPPVSISVNGDTLLAYNSVTYQWYLNGNVIPGATNPLLIATQTGSYTVLISDANGCTALSLPVVITVTGIADLKKETMSVYPNPNYEGKWNLSVSTGWLNAQCEVFDAEGRLVFKSTISNQQSEINMNVANGVYLLRITNGSRTTTQKLIKQ